MITDDDSADSETPPDYGSKFEREDGRPKDDEHQRAIERLQLSAEAYYRQRERERKALTYQVPDLMWSKEAKDLRRGEQIQNITIPPRPTVAIPKVDQSVQLVLNSERAAHIGVTFHPLDEEADDETAEVMTGIYRTIERLSRAGLARSWGFERGVKAGLGGWRIVTVPSETYAKTKDQDIRIQRMLYQESAFPDPFAIEPDWSDGEFLLILEWVSWAKYKRLNKNGRRRNEDTGQPEEFPSLLATMSDGDLTKLALEAPSWVRGDGEGRAVLTGEYMYLEDRPEDDAKAVADGWRDGEQRRVCWRRLDPVEFTDYGIIHANWIPWVPAVGKELIPFDDERRWVGMYEPNRGAQDAFNYAASTAIESMAQEPRATWLLAEGQEEGHEREFLLANVRNFPYLRYKPKAIGQDFAPPPTRTQADTSKLGLSIQMLSMSNDWLHAGTAMYEPSLGQSSPNVKTKGGTLALQQQGEQANSNWLDNHSEVSLMHEARIIASMIPYYYDRPGRVMRLLGRLGEKNDAKTVMVNHPFVMQRGRPTKLPYGTPEEQAQTDHAVADPDNPAKHYVLSKGLYGTAVSIGKGYKALVDQGADELGQLFQAEPELFKILGDIYLRFRDFPGHEEAAERVQKMLPPQLQKQDGEQDPRMQLQQAQAALQQMQQQMQEMAQKLAKDQTHADAQIAVASLREDAAKLKTQIDLEIAYANNATKIAVAKITAAKSLAEISSEAALETQATGRQHAFDAHQAEQDRLHEANEADKDRAHQMATGAAGAASDAASQQAGHEQSLEAQAAGADQTAAQSTQDAGEASAAADQAHGQTLEQIQAAPSGNDAGSE